MLSSLTPRLRKCLVFASILRPHASMSSVSAAAHDWSHYETALGAVDVGAPPRVELLRASRAAAPELECVAVLDSSFNPPTRAHLHMLNAACEHFGLQRRLLLLSKQNADKPVVGASLPQRLCMMEMIAEADRSSATLCGVTAHPLFVDKATALQTLCGEEARICLLVGFDTWVRVVDPKYYAEGELESTLARLFEKVEVVVTSRDPLSASAMQPVSVEEQAAAVAALPQTLTRGRLHFMRNNDDVAAFSSSAIRTALGGHQGEEHGEEMLPECVREFVEQQGLYK